MARRVRRFWSDEEKRRIVAQSYAPGVSVSVVARRYDVNSTLIFTWRRDPRYKPAADADDAPVLPAGGGGARAFCAIGAGRIVGGRIEIALSNGHRVSAIGSFDVDALCRVVRALGG